MLLANMIRVKLDNNNYITYVKFHLCKISLMTKLMGWVVIKFDSNYSGNQHWYFHLVGGVQGLRLAILSVKGIENEGVPLPFFKVKNNNIYFYS